MTVERIIIEMEPKYMVKVRRAYNIFKAIPDEHKSLQDWDGPIETWLAGKLLKLDYRKARVENICLMVASGLSTSEIRHIIQEGSPHDLLSAEEDSLLNAVDTLAEQNGYSMEVIRGALFNKHCIGHDEFEILKMDVDSFKVRS